MQLVREATFDSVLNHILIRVLLPIVSILSIFYLLYLVFMIVPNEAVMGAVQRIFYFHVGAATASYLFVGFVFAASCFYLFTKEIIWINVLEAANEIALVLSTIVLASGMIWGHSSWNTWWRWEPRLVSFLVLWLILFSSVALKNLSSSSRITGNYLSVLGVFSGINIPIVMFSIKILNRTEQLHPQVVAEQGLRHPSFTYTLIWGIVSVTIFSLWFFVVRLNLARVESKLLRKEIDI